MAMVMTPLLLWNDTEGHALCVADAAMSGSSGSEWYPLSFMLTLLLQVLLGGQHIATSNNDEWCQEGDYSWLVR